MFRRIGIMEYPYRGEFYVMGIDVDKPPLEQVEERNVILNTECDIQEASHSDGNVITSGYSVYFPMRGDLSAIRNGIMFDGDMDGIRVNGKVSGVFASQAGGVKVYIKDLDV